MCGLAGFYKPSASDQIAVLKNMLEPLTKRGPDQEGVYTCKNNALYLGHKRLSIQDTSEAGVQPMISQCQRYVLVFNGEIYNFIELRKAFDKVQPNYGWQGHSDTEVLLAYISFYGLESTLPKLNGMFAIALYDMGEEKVFFARDRFGEKPLYIYANNHSFAFASELRPIELFTKNLTLNHSAIDAQLRFSYIPAPASIYNEVFKLMPGTFLAVDLNNYEAINVEDAIPYWDIAQTIEIGLKNRNQFLNVDDAVTETERVLKESVKKRMVSDVPLGSFLSGGIDSTCITALMQEQSEQKIKTFSIGFNDKNYNEAHHAKAIAGVLGTEHHELYLNPNDMLEHIENLPYLYDEPFADSSQLPTLMVSKFAKEQVTVALTGDAGDEVFCGYNRYTKGVGLLNSYGSIPFQVRKGIGNALRVISPQQYLRLFKVLALLIPKLRKYKNIGDKVHKLARVLDFKDEADLYQKLIVTWPETAFSSEVVDVATDITQAFSYQGISVVERMMWQDTIGYLQNDILCKVDRASMAFSLETRIPFLDNDVFQHAWSLPLDAKLHHGLTKYPLRKIISKHIPDEIMNRPKAGFGAPIVSWLRHELKDWAEDLLSDSSLDDIGFFDKKHIKKVWHNHQTGRSSEQYALWNLLIFLQWKNSRR